MPAYAGIRSIELGSRLRGDDKSGFVFLRA